MPLSLFLSREAKRLARKHKSCAFRRLSAAYPHQFTSRSTIAQSGERWGLPQEAAAAAQA